ncbi:transglycosylase SLT domain-containing protein [Streptomyces sp. XD-27]|uniref:aggregation-promoting factor C-terminal-like domain-containing protein n=1 Tax=Streptomyces sp. XD-27 TaxID=3062779 RepID=UPI0026F455E3|nr:transglycosylase SLT domain-containing protein [Streptomyces sp. XD-27]WKX70092.1 transglycosylase SLT domain-containing protein [Streptomyces sp. XD-27]
MSADPLPSRTVPRRKSALLCSVAALSAAGVALSAAPTEAAGLPLGSEAREIARRMIPNRTQFKCFSKLVERESGWRVTVTSPTGAYGLLQALPGSKMASAGADWRTNPATQISWGLEYIKDRYGSPCEAWAFWRSKGWY